MFTPRKTLTILSVALAAGLLCAANKPPQPAPSTYTLTMLKVPAGCTVSSANGVNDFGQIIGGVSTGTGGHAVVWETASAVPTQLDNGVGTSSVVAINNLGQILGTCAIGATYHHVVWVPRPGGGYDMKDLATGPNVWLNDINDRGEVTGHIDDAAHNSWGFVVVPEDTDGDGTADTWFRDDNGDGTNDLMFVVPAHFFPVTAGTLMLMDATAINDMGWMVGASYMGEPYYEHSAFLIIPDYELPNPWFTDADGDGLNDLLIELPNGFHANDVSNGGQIVDDHADLFAVAEDGTITQTTVLPTPTTRYRWSFAMAINESGQVVGWGHSNGNSAQEPFLWQKDKGTVLLQSKVSSMAGFSALTTAVGINNGGLIIGTGTTRAGNRAYLATPPAGN